MFSNRQAYEHFIESSVNRCSKADWPVINLESYPVKTTENNLDPELANSYFISSDFDFTKALPVTNAY